MALSVSRDGGGRGLHLVTLARGPSSFPGCADPSGLRPWGRRTDHRHRHHGTRLPWWGRGRGPGRERVSVAKRLTWGGARGRSDCSLLVCASGLGDPGWLCPGDPALPWAVGLPGPALLSHGRGLHGFQWGLTQERPVPAPTLWSRLAQQRQSVANGPSRGGPQPTLVVSKSSELARLHR